MIDERAAEFLARSGWQSATLTPVAGDASARQYLRLKQDNASAILMLAPPAPDDSTVRFVEIGQHLVSLGLSAPHIIEAEADAGFCLMEDLGDAIFAKLIAAQPDQERTLYGAAIAFLGALQQHSAPDFLPAPDVNALAALTAPAADWYVGRGTAQPDLAAACAAALRDPLRETLSAGGQPVLVHRDFHAENLIWLDDRTGPARVGVIDFQDAWAGHPAYDLVSLIQDARRDLTAGLAPDMIVVHADLIGADPAAHAQACDVLGAQRNLRILGVFARLCLHFGKPRYVDLIPRVWHHLQSNLENPALAELREVVQARFPEPDPNYLQALRDECGTIQTP